MKFQAVAAQMFFILAQSIIQHLWMAGDELDEVTCKCMQHHEMVSQEMTGVLKELKQNGMAQGCLPFTAMLQWQCWAIAVALTLLFGPCL
ncbi:hypothetical protein BTVI_152616 [Pitangus sulphuratus]|nr:hypothetical protein BTVI_152616 [Pitangus sulphuratus]